MADVYRAVYLGGSGEIVEKKSRFIAYVEPTKTEEEALAFIEKIRKQDWDARHHCFAYVIGDRSELQRGSDDGEPSGTAGRPMLDVLNGQNLHNTTVVVTRYFGGVLLGTGGLVRAYTQAVHAGLEGSIVIEQEEGVSWTISTDYNGIGKIQYLLGQKKIAILDSEYSDQVRLDIVVKLTEEKQLEKELMDATNGRAGIHRGEECRFARIDGETKIFPI